VDIDEVIAEFNEYKERKEAGLGASKTAIGTKSIYEEDLSDFYQFRDKGYSPTKRLVKMRQGTLKHKI
jgi:hypothetical protein